MRQVKGVRRRGGWCVFPGGSGLVTFQNTVVRIYILDPDIY